MLAIVKTFIWQLDGDVIDTRFGQLFFVCLDSKPVTFQFLGGKGIHQHRWR